MANAGNILIRIAAETGGIASDLGKIENRFGQFEKSVTSTFSRIGNMIASAISVGAITSLYKTTLEAGHNIELMSQKFGIGAETLSGFSISAKMSGVEIEALGKGLKFLARSTSEAAKPGSDMARTFGQMGISARDATGSLKPLDVLAMEMADKFASWKDSTEKTALAIAVLGRSGQDMIPWLNLGGERIRQLAEDSKELGAVWTDETSTAAGDLMFNVERLGFFIDAIGISVVTKTAPAFTKVTDSIIRWAKETQAAQNIGKGLAVVFELIAKIGNILVFIFRLAGDAIAGAGGILSKFVEAIIDLSSLNLSAAKRSLMEIPAVFSAMTDQMKIDAGKYADTMKDLDSPAEAIDKATKKKGTAPLVMKGKDPYLEALKKIRDEAEKSWNETAGLSNKAWDSLTRFSEKGLDPAVNAVKKLDDEYLKVIVDQARLFEKTGNIDEYVKNVDTLNAVYDEVRSKLQGIVEWERERGEIEAKMASDTRLEEQANAMAEAYRAIRDLSDQALIQPMTQGSLAARGYEDVMVDLANRWEAGKITMAEYVDLTVRWKAAYDEIARSPRNVLQDALIRGDAMGAINALLGGVVQVDLKTREATDAANMFASAWMYANTTITGYLTQVAEVGFRAFQELGDIITDTIMTGKSQFRDFANAVIADIMRIAVRAAVIAPIMNGILGFLGMGGGGAAAAGVTSINPAFYSLTPRAGGGPVSPGTAYLVGESGPEVLIPQSAGTIVPSDAGGNRNVTVNIKNESGERIHAKSARATFDAQGWVIDMVIDGVSRNVHGIRDMFGGS